MEPRVTRVIEDPATQFEAVLLRQMLRESKLGAGLGGEGGLGADLFVDAVADMIARAGGLGLADTLKTQLAGSAAPGSAAGTAADPLTALITGRGQITSGYGVRPDPFHGAASFHHGVDIAAPRGTDIHAPLAGEVTFSGAHGGHGNLVEIRTDDGVVTRLAHADRLLVKKGDRVSEGQVVATVGSTGRSTGPHVHVEMYVRGAQADPTALKDLAEGADDGTRR